MIKLNTEDSTSIQRLEYDYVKEQLFITFKSGGRYRYDEVEPESFAMLYFAESIGNEYHCQIKGCYPCEKV